MRVVLPLALLALAVACTGEDPVGSGSSSSSSTSSGGNAIADGSTAPVCTEPDTCGPNCDPCPATDASICEAPRQLCGEACVAVESDPENCGRCGNRCEGTACALGRCAPQEVLAGFVGHFEVMGSDLYVARRSDVAQNSVIVRCSSSEGCGNSTPLAEAVGTIGKFVIADGQIAFADNRADNQDGALRSCPLAGCVGAATVLLDVDGSSINDLALGPETLGVGISRSLQARGNLSAVRRPLRPGAVISIDSSFPTQKKLYSTLAVGQSFIVFSQVTDNGPHLARIGIAVGASATTGPAVGPVARTRLVGDDVWFATASSASKSQIVKTPSFVTSTGTVVREEAPGLRDFTVTDDGKLYTLNDATGEIRRCDLTPSCDSTSVALAVAQPGPRQLEVDATHVYWSTSSGIYRTPR